MPWFSGLLVGMGSLLLTLSLSSRMVFGLDSMHLYFWNWFRGSGWAMTPGVITVTAFYITRPTSKSRIRNLAGWFSGIATVYMVWTALSLDPGFEVYRYLFTPLVWIAVLSCTAFILDHGLRMERRIQFLILAVALILPSLFTLIPMLYIYNEKITAWLIVIVLAAGSSAMIYMDSRGWSI